MLPGKSHAVEADDKACYLFLTNSYLLDCVLNLMDINTDFIFNVDLYFTLSLQFFIAMLPRLK